MATLSPQGCFTSRRRERERERETSLAPPSSSVASRGVLNVAYHVSRNRIFVSLYVRKRTGYGFYSGESFVGQSYLRAGSARLLWNHTVHYCAQKSPQLDPVHTSCFLGSILLLTSWLGLCFPGRLTLQPPPSVSLFRRNLVTPSLLGSGTGHVSVSSSQGHAERFLTLSQLTVSSSLSSHRRHILWVSVLLHIFSPKMPPAPTLGIFSRFKFDGGS